MDFDNEFLENADDEYQRLKDEGYKSIQERDFDRSFERACREYESWLANGGYYY